MSVIVDSPDKIKFTIAPFLITNGPVCELSIVIEFNVIVAEICFATSIWHSLHEPEIVYSLFEFNVKTLLLIV